MARDVLTLDVEINPTQLAQQTDMARDTIARNLSTSGSGFGIGGPAHTQFGNVIGGPWGGLSPEVPAFAPQSAIANLWQGIFPTSYAPLSTSPDQYGGAMLAKFNQRVSVGAVDTAASLADVASEGLGMWGGTAAGAALGARFGVIGAGIGGVIGGVAGGGLAGSISRVFTDPIRGATENYSQLQNTLAQEGYRAGAPADMFSGIKGGVNALRTSGRLVDGAYDASLITAMGMDAKEFASKVLQGGLKNNLFTQGNFESEDKIVESNKQLMTRTLRVMQAFRASLDESLEIMGELKKLGATDDASMSLQMGVMGQAFKSGMNPKELLEAANYGSQIARMANMSGFTGMSTATQEGLILADARRSGDLSDERVAAGGGIARIAGGITRSITNQFRSGMPLSNLLFAAQDGKGHIDMAKFNRLVEGKMSPTQVNLEAVNKLTELSGGDMQKWLEARREFEFNKDKLTKELSEKDPDMPRKAFISILEGALKYQGVKNITQASIYDAALNYDPNMSEAEARALASSYNKQSSFDSKKKADATRDEFDLSNIARQTSVKGIANLIRGRAAQGVDSVTLKALLGSQEYLVDLEDSFQGFIHGDASALDTIRAKRAGLDTGLENLLTSRKKATRDVDIEAIDESVAKVKARMAFFDDLLKKDPTQIKQAIKTESIEDQISTLRARETSLQKLLRSAKERKDVNAEFELEGELTGVIAGLGRAEELKKSGKGQYAITADLEKLFSDNPGLLNSDVEKNYLSGKNIDVPQKVQALEGHLVDIKNHLATIAGSTSSSGGYNYTTGTYGSGLNPSSSANKYEKNGPEGDN